MEGSPDSPRVSTPNPLTARVEVAHRWVPATGRERGGGKGTERGFLGGVLGRRQLRRLDRIPPKCREERGKGTSPPDVIDHIARDTFVISSESVRSGSGRSIVILLGQGKRFGDSIRLGRVEPRVENPVVAA